MSRLTQFLGSFTSLPRELYQNRTLLLRLARNDFRTRFAGSYLGTVWAFIQPIVTVFVYWFVFGIGLRSPGEVNQAGIEIPFFLWMLAGIVPWFFFQEALLGATNVLMEYSYLVKKIVFKISILPIVKMVSALFVHIFFVVFVLVLYAIYGFFPDLYSLQVIYYSAAMFLLILGISYATCSIVVFFRDLTQIINVFLQIGIWMTPIMWNIDRINVPPMIRTILQLNPMFYIVFGYRDALINKAWFWQHPTLTIYFWVFTIAMFVIGTMVFRKLKVHFADVL